MKPNNTEEGYRQRSVKVSNIKRRRQNSTEDLGEQMEACQSCRVGDTVK